MLHVVLVGDALSLVQDRCRPLLVLETLGPVTMERHVGYSVPLLG